MALIGFLISDVLNIVLAYLPNCQFSVPLLMDIQIHEYLLNYHGLDRENSSISIIQVRKLIDKVFAEYVAFPSQFCSEIRPCDMVFIRNTLRLQENAVIAPLYLVLVLFSELRHQIGHDLNSLCADIMGELWQQFESHNQTVILEDGKQKSSRVIEAWSLLALIVARCMAFSFRGFLHWLVFVGLVQGSYSAYRSLWTVNEVSHRCYRTNFIFIVMNNRSTRPLISLMLTDSFFCSEFKEWSSKYPKEAETVPNEMQVVKEVCCDFFEHHASWKATLYMHMLSEKELSCSRSLLQDSFSSAVVKFKKLINE
jgi:hypothetical protein